MSGTPSYEVRPQCFVVVAMVVLRIVGVFSHVVRCVEVARRNEIKIKPYNILTAHAAMDCANLDLGVGPYVCGVVVLSHWGPGRRWVSRVEGEVMAELQLVQGDREPGGDWG